jgi:hypothetical protein
VDSITIPVGPRLGGKVLEVEGLKKAMGDKLLVEDMNFTVPPGGGKFTLGSSQCRRSWE